MKKLIAASLLTLVTCSSSFADCSNAYKVKAKARAELIKDIKKTGAISGAVVISAATLATMAVEFVIAPGPSWFLIPPTAFAGNEAVFALLDAASETKANNFNTFYQALGTITAAEGGALPKQLIHDLNEKLNLDSLSSAEQSEVLKEAVKIIHDGNESNLFCQKKENGRYKIYSYRKMLKHLVTELN